MEILQNIQLTFRNSIHFMHSTPNFTCFKCRTLHVVTPFVSVLCKIDNIGVLRLLRSSSIEHMVDDCQTYLWLSFTEPSGDEWKWYLQDASNTNLREKEYMLYVAFDLLLCWFWWCSGVHSVEQFNRYLCFVKSADQNQN